MIENMLMGQQIRTRFLPRLSVSSVDILRSAASFVDVVAADAASLPEPGPFAAGPGFNCFWSIHNLTRPTKLCLCARVCVCVCVCAPPSHCYFIFSFKIRILEFGLCVCV